jgi:hypothetical protein
LPAVFDKVFVKILPPEKEECLMLRLEVFHGDPKTEHRNLQWLIKNLQDQKMQHE